MVFLLLLLMALLAFANGANDSSKGVATLVGYGTAKPRQALLWATAATALGGAFSFWFAGGLIKGFSTGLFVKGTPLEPALFVAVLVGACAWILFATFTGLPVSTTHAIIGGLTGAGLVMLGSTRMEWGFLGAKFAVPLALSPLLSMLLVYLVSWPVVRVVRRVAGRCACVTEGATLQPSGGAAVAAAATRLSVVVDEEAACAQESPVVAVSATSVSDRLHWLSGGLTSFARGWNDTPKIAALGLLAIPGSEGMLLAFGLVMAAMAAGGLLAGRKVLETLSQKVTPLPLPESLTASLATAALVGMASWNGLPVSTTHVSTGAIIGAGLRNDARAVKWSKVGEIGLSWLITLPAAGLVAALVALVIR
jgi:inorganic phosphate transporter, PiT family